MKANIYSEHQAQMKVYLNGTLIRNAIEADEEAGYVLALYKDAEDNFLDESLAAPGAMIFEGVEVVRHEGNVKIEGATTNQGMFIPLQIKKKE